MRIALNIRGFNTCLILFMLLAIPLSEVKANELVTDLSTSEVAIQANFDGETVLLFGAYDTSRKNASPDIVVILRGPDEALKVRRKDKTFGLWVNTESLSVSSTPSYYAVAASRALADIASPEIRQEMGIGLDYVPTKLASTHEDTDLFLEGLIRNKQSRNLYSENPSGVKIIGNRLFRTEIALPPGVPMGIYEAKIILFDAGNVLSMQNNTIIVGIAGFEQFLHRLAHQLPILYGITGVLIAVFFGWIATVLFRRRS